MKSNLRKLIIICIILFAVPLSLLKAVAVAPSYQNKVLILYDDGRATAQYRAHQNTLANLMGHFKLPYTKKPIGKYNKGNINNYRATFYIGNKQSNTLPKTFLNDVIDAKRPIIWLNFNLRRIAQATTYKAKFVRKYRIRYVKFLGSSNPFKTVKYSGKKFTKAQKTISRVHILNSKVAKSRARAYSSSSSIPYIVNSGNFWFVADNPLNLWYEDQAYIVFAELLHDMVRIRHSYNRRALVRIEDVTAESNPARLKAIADYLYSQKVPFSVGVIARFYDPLGATGPPRTIDLDKSPEVVKALKYMVSKGGTILMHGFTHQYDQRPNPFNGVTGDDGEFHLHHADGGVGLISPVPEDSEKWVQARIDGARAIFNKAGLPQPSIWETPHYAATDLDYRVFAKNFGKSYERTPDAYFPYLIHKSVFGKKIIPENLGYVEPGRVWALTIVNRADKNLVVRDGFASFFFHSRLDMGYLQKMVQGIKVRGYRFVNVNYL